MVPSPSKLEVHVPSYEFVKARDLRISLSHENDITFPPCLESALRESYSDRLTADVGEHTHTRANLLAGWDISGEQTMGWRRDKVGTVFSPGDIWQCLEPGEVMWSVASFQWAEARDVKQLTGLGVTSPILSQYGPTLLPPFAPKLPPLEPEANLGCSDLLVNQSLVHRSTSVFPGHPVLPSSHY